MLLLLVCLNPQCFELLKAWEGSNERKIVMCCIMCTQPYLTPHVIGRDCDFSLSYETFESHVLLEREDHSLCVSL